MKKKTGTTTKSKERSKKRQKTNKSVGEDQQFIADNMSKILQTIVNGVAISKCTSVNTGRGVYPKIPENSQCVRIPMDDYVFMIRRMGESFILTSFFKFLLDDATEFMRKTIGMPPESDGTSCRSLSSAFGRDLKVLDSMYADSPIFVTPVAEEMLRSYKQFKPYRDAPGIRDGVVLVNIGYIGEHQVFRTTGVICEDPDYRTPELYWLDPMFSVSFEKRFRKPDGREVDNSVYWMFDDLFFELFTLESVEWVRNSGLSEMSFDGDDSGVAVATDEEDKESYDVAAGDRIRVLLKNQIESMEDSNVQGEPAERNIVYTKEQVGGIDPVLQASLSDIPIGGWMTLKKQDHPDFLRSTDATIAAVRGDEVVGISVMDMGDETIFILSEMSKELKKRRCRVFHEEDFANWSLCRVRMKRVADMELDLIH